MAVNTDPVRRTVPDRAPLPVSTAAFVRLKLRILGNGMRGSPARVVRFVIAGVFGLVLAGLGFLAFFASGVIGHDGGYVLAALVGAAIVLGWVLLPLLFFGVDETLDPARFALLPLRRPTLAKGMLAGAVVGVPGAATALAMTALVVAGALRAGVAGAVVGLAGAVLAVLVCVLASRAVTSALAELLRSRRVRDLAAIILALVAASIGPLNLLISSTVAHASLDPVLRVARVLGWTPLSAAFVAPYDIADGRPLLAVARLLVMAATAALLMWWWSTTLESAMIGTTAAAPSGNRAGRGGAVATLLPRLLRRATAGPLVAITARELRYWWRDPRRRAAIISVTVGGAVVPIALRATAAGDGDGGTVPLPVAVAFAALLAGAMLANQFGMDGRAYAAHLLAGVPGRVDLRARANAITIIMLPVVMVITVAVAVLTGDLGALVPTIGTVGAMFGTSTGVGSVVSVLVPYPMPESRNAFAVGNGTGGAKGLLALVGMVASLVLAAPVLVGALFLHGFLAWVLAPIGIAWGLAAVLVCTYIAGDTLDRRGPEVLIAVGAR